MVLGKEDMASLMADIHIAEAMVDMNSSAYPTDSSRLALKQSIYAAHGVTSEQVESSYIWYGHHIEDYMAVYDRTIAIIEDKQRQMLTASSEQVLVAGDSVNIWPLASHMEFSRRSPSRIVTFSIPADSNWRHHDVFSLRFNMAHTTLPVNARMNVEYADGTTSYNLVSGKSRGKADVCVRIDSARQPLRIDGYIIASPREGETVLLDSIALVRMREYIPVSYFSTRNFNYGAPTVRTRPAPSRADSLPSAGAPAKETKSPSQGMHHPQISGGHKSDARRQAPATPGKSAAQEAVEERNRLLRQSQRTHRH